MTAALELAIAGFRFAVEAPGELRLIEDDPTYVRFLAPGPAPDVEIAVSLTLETAPDVSGLPVLFDTEETWTAYDDGGDIVLRLRAGESDPYLWQARLAAALDRVTIHCGPRLVQQRDDLVEVDNPLHYPLDQLLMMFVLPLHQGLLIHAAGLSRGDRGVFLAGVSGAGKTTFMRQCEGCVDLDGLSDDRVITRHNGPTTRVFGTPWAGEGRVAANRGADLAAIAFLHQASRNELRRLDPGEALRQLLATVSILWFDRERMELAMAACKELVENLPCYELHFRPEPGAANLLDELI
ncbi:MAG: hypothetical protein GY719_07200 [bacterium]|nr:hypothetical protein [bacterium]